MRLRTGRKLGRTLYLQVGPGPDYRDLFVGMMDTAAMAQLVVEAFNAAYEDQPL